MVGNLLSWFYEPQVANLIHWSNNLRIHERRLNAERHSTLNERVDQVIVTHPLPLFLYSILASSYDSLLIKCT
jgi:hypothetical protein